MKGGADIVVAGIGETLLAKLPSVVSVELQGDAGLHTVNVATLSLQEVDGLLNLGPFAQRSSMFATTLGGMTGGAQFTALTSHHGPAEAKQFPYAVVLMAPVKSPRMLPHMIGADMIGNSDQIRVNFNEMQCCQPMIVGPEGAA